MIEWTNKRLWVSLSFTVFSLGILGLRFQYGVAVISSLFLLFVFILSFSGAKTPLILLSCLLLLSYTGARFNYIFGYDAQSVAILTNFVYKSGWPIRDIIYSGGFPETPLIYIHTVIVHLISDIPLFRQDTFSIVSIQAILPTIYLAVVLLLVYSLWKKFIPGIDESILLCSVVFFTPFFYWASFRRQTIGYLMFALVFFTFMLYYLSAEKTNRVRSVLLLITAIISLVLSHHMSSAQVFVLGLIMAIILTTSFQSYLSGQRLIVLGLLFISFTTVWYLWMADNRLGFFLSLMPRILDIFSSSASAPTTDNVNLSLLVRFRTGYAKWLYQLVLAGGLSLLVINHWRSEIRVDHNHQIVQLVFGFGFLTAVLAAIGTQTMVIPTTRQMIFFVIIGGPLSLLGWKVLDDDIDIPVLKIAVFILFILGVTMVPPHYISQTTVGEGEKSERIQADLYQGSDWAKNYYDGESVRGDAKVYATMTTYTQIIVNNDVSQISSGEIPDGAILLRDNNNKTFRGSFSDTLVTVSTEGLVRKAEREKNLVYNNGDIKLFTDRN